MQENKNQTDLQRLSDFAGKEGFEMIGEKLNVEDVLNKELKILKFSVKKSEYHEGDYCNVQIEIGDKTAWFRISSIVVIKQLKEYENKLPFSGKITKRKNYYTIC